MNCEECTYYAYDEEDEYWYCTADMDEDDMARLMNGGRECPFYRDADEYKVVRHQM